MTEQEGMLPYKATRKQRSAVRDAEARLKLSVSMNPPKEITVNRERYATLVKYARDLDYLCISEKVIGYTSKEQDDE